MRFRDINQFTRDGNYRVNACWRHLESTLTSFGAPRGIDFDPDYQRGHVWNESKQVAYVEFILKGGRSSKTLLLNCPGWMRGLDGRLELVDGKQRLEAVRKFMRNDLRAFGHLLSDFDDQPPIMQAEFIICVNDLATRAEVLQWYLDLNSGGVVHTEEELERVRELLRKEAGK